MQVAWMVAVLLVPQAQAAELQVTLVGNAGVLLADGASSLLVDLPYQSGAFGYMKYRPGDLDPAGSVVSVITHHHSDHFDPELFERRQGWRIVAPPSVTEGLPRDRSLTGDSIQVGNFSIRVIPTPHTPDHRSYRVGWRGRVLHFVGDTEDPASLADGPEIDVLFVTPWLSCAIEASPQARYGIGPGKGVCEEHTGAEESLYRIRQKEGLERLAIPPGV